MQHPIHRVTTVDVVADYIVDVGFDDGTMQRIDLEPILAGALYAPLCDSELFRQVRVDPEARTLLWPNGADFDPATLHDWPVSGPALSEIARGW